MPPKKVRKVLKLHIHAGEAGPAAVAKDLGPHGINIMQFCQAYNAATASQRGHVVPAHITVYEDRSFTFVTRTPTTASLLRHAAGIKGGSQRPNGRPAAWISREQLREIARVKLPDLNTTDLETAERMVAGTARSMGVGVRAQVL
jgi:large subunit ribosomal protein L11